MNFFLDQIYPDSKSHKCFANWAFLSYKNVGLVKPGQSYFSKDDRKMQIFAFPKRLIQSVHTSCLHSRSPLNSALLLEGAVCAMHTVLQHPDHVRCSRGRGQKLETSGNTRGGRMGQPMGAPLQNQSCRQGAAPPTDATVCKPKRTEEPRRPSPQLPQATCSACSVPEWVAWAPAHA